MPGSEEPTRVKLWRRTSTPAPNDGLGLTLRVGWVVTGQRKNRPFYTVTFKLNIVIR